MPEGLILLGPDGRVLLLNTAARRLFQPPGNPLGRTLLEVTRHHELTDLAQRTLAAASPALPTPAPGGPSTPRTGTSAKPGPHPSPTPSPSPAPEQEIEAGFELELELSPPGSPRVVVQIHATPFDLPDPGPPTPAPAGERGVLLALHDVTRLKELERTRREFVANVSHELRTPLTLIKGYVETLIDGALSNPEVARRFLGTIEKHTNRLSFLIDDLLTISQLESGTSVMNRCQADLRPIASHVLEDLATKAADRSIHLQNDIPPDLQIHADPDRIQQVLFNLVDNAIKYGRPSGSVTLGASPSTQPHAQHVELWVADDGPGIPREALDRVFERFYRVDAARSRDQGGTGLGLAIVKHIVQAHGGSVRAESEPGRGATFRLRLPAGPTAAD